MEQQEVSPIFIRNHSYYVFRGKEEKAISNFTMEPLELIECIDGGVYTIRFTLNSGKYFDKQISSSVFSGARQFKQMLKKDNLELSYIGGDIDLELIQSFMLSMYPNHPRKQGIDFTGMIKKENQWLYVDMNGAIDRNGNQRKDILSLIADNKAVESNLLESEPISIEELKKISHALFHFNTYQRTIPIVAWSAACFLKERLSERKIKYSHLMMFGQKGDGKSETEDNIIQPIFGMKNKSLACKGMTNFSLMKTCHSTNLVPVILEEYKPSFLSVSEINLISNVLRSAYDGQSGQRGRADQSIVSYLRRAPMIIVGESSFDEPAIKERCIEVQFGKIDRTQYHTEQFKFLASQEKLLNKLGRSLLEIALQISDEELDKLIESSKKFDDCNYETRIIQGLNNLCLGLLLLKKLFQSYDLDFFELTGVTLNQMIESITENVDLTLDENGRMKSVVENAIETMDIMAMKGKIRDGEHYAVDIPSNELRLRLNLIYDEFTKYVKEYGIEGLEKLSSRQFTKQLKNVPYLKFKESINRTFCVPCKDDYTKKEDVSCKCWILLLDIANQYMELEAFYYDITKDVETEFTTEIPDDLPFQEELLPQI